MRLADERLGDCASFQRRAREIAFPGINPVSFVSFQAEARSASKSIEVSHSHRSAVTGLTLAARRAGNQPASTVIMLTTRRATAKDIGSIASTAKS